MDFSVEAYLKPNKERKTRGMKVTLLSVFFFQEKMLLECPTRVGFLFRISVGRPRHLGAHLYLMVGMGRKVKRKLNPSEVF